MHHFLIALGDLLNLWLEGQRAEPEKEQAD